MTVLDGIPFLPAVFFTRGREAKIDTIVVHWMAGTLASTDATFTGGNREASAHFGIEDTKVHQYVREADTAWHAGDRPTNHRSIGIEHSAQPGRDASPATIATSVALIVALCRKYSISPDRIFGHKKFTATACPGTLPVAEIIARVRAQLTTPIEETDMPLTLADADLIVKRLLGTELGASGIVVATALQLAAKSGVPVDVDEKAIAGTLAGLILPALQANVAVMSDDEIQAIAKAVNDETLRRLEP